MTVNLRQRHLASECDAVNAQHPFTAAGDRCIAWYKTECVWCDVKIHMHRKQYGKNVQTCSAKCRVARHRALKKETAKVTTEA